MEGNTNNDIIITVTFNVRTTVCLIGRFSEIMRKKILCSLPVVR